MLDRELDDGNREGLAKILQSMTPVKDISAPLTQASTSSPKKPQASRIPKSSFSIICGILFSMLFYSTRLQDLTAAFGASPNAIFLTLLLGAVVAEIASAIHNDNPETAQQSITLQGLQTMMASGPPQHDSAAGIPARLDQFLSAFTRLMAFIAAAQRISNALLTFLFSFVISLVIFRVLVAV